MIPNWKHMVWRHAYSFMRGHIRGHVHCSGMALVYFQLSTSDIVVLVYNVKEAMRAGVKEMFKKCLLMPPDSVYVRSHAEGILLFSCCILSSFHL